MVIDTSCHCGDVRPLSCNKMRFDYRMKIMRYTTFLSRRLLQFVL